MKKKSLKSQLKTVKMLYHIACILAIIGGILLIGTAGALECEFIGAGQAMLQCAICGTALLLFAKCSEYLDTYMETIKKQIRSKNAQMKKEKALVAYNRAQIIEFMKQHWNDYGQIDHA